MDNEKVSIVVIIYKVEAFLEKCLESLKKQTYQNIEVIMTVGSDSDSCLEICKRYAKSDPRFVLVLSHTSEICTARNAGLKRVTGDYLAWVDGDDWVEERYIEDLYRQITKTKTDLALCGFQKAKDQLFIPVISALPSDVSFPIVELYREILSYQSFGMEIWDKLFHSKEVKGITFPEGKEAEDRFWLQQVLAQAKTASYVGKANYNYRIRPGTSSASKHNASFSFEADKLLCKQIMEDYPALTHEVHFFLFLSKYRVFYEMLNAYPHAAQDSLRASYLELKTYAKKALAVSSRRNDRIKMRLSLAGYGPFKLFVQLSGICHRQKSKN